MKDALQPAALDQIFRTARTYNEWTDRTVDEQVVRSLYDLLKWGPTSANCCPARFVWVQSADGKANLASLAAEMNRPKILSASLTVIIGNDLNFSSQLPKLLQLLPPARIAHMQKTLSQPEVAAVTAMRNGSLQGAYLIIAARALGLDCGPMSGFDNDSVDRAFFAGTAIKSNFICSLGYGRAESPHPRNPRLSFEETGRFA